MATRDVSTISEFNSAQTASASGDTIRFTDSWADYSGDVTVSKAGLTLMAATARAVGPRRIITTSAAVNTTIADLAIQCREATSHSSNTPTPDLIQINAGGTIIQNNLIRCGDSDNAVGGIFPAFDVTKATGDNRPEYGIIGGDSTYNWMKNVPRGLLLSRFAGALLVADNSFEDLGDAFKGSLTSNSSVDIRILRNDFIRPYQDAVSLGFAPRSTGEFFTVTRFDIIGNFFKNLFATPQDNGNPHGDCIQIFSADVGAASDSQSPIPNLVVRRNVQLQTEDCRGQGSFIFLSDVPPGYPFINPVVEDNLRFGRMDGRGINVTNGLGAGYSSRIVRNVILMNPANNLPTQRESTRNNVSGITGITSPSASNINITSDSIKPSSNFVTRNLAEVFAPNSANRGGRNFGLGKATTLAQYDAYFAIRPNYAAMATADDVVNALKLLKSDYADCNPVKSTDNWAGFRNGTDFVETPFIGFVDLVGQTKSAVVQSTWSFIQKGGTLSALSGGQYRIADDYNGTNATAFSSTTGVVLPAGKHIQFQQTVPSSQLNTATMRATMGGASVAWSVTAKGEILFPDASFAGAGRYISAAGPMGPAGNMCTMGMRFKASTPASNTQLFASTGTAGIDRRQSIENLTSGKVRLQVRDNTGTAVMSVTNTATVLDGTNYVEILMSLDLTVPFDEGGLQLYVNGLPDPIAPTTYTLNGVIDYAQSIGRVVGGASSPSFAGNLQMLWIDPTQALDLRDPDIRSRFDPARILKDGSGPTGYSPWGFFVGTAAGIVNRGSGPAFTLNGTAPADGNGQPWPPAISQYGISTITVRDANGQEASLDPFYITIAA